MNRMKPTYNMYLTEEAQKQANNSGLQVLRVRMPYPGEVVVRYETTDCYNTMTLTELAAYEAEQDKGE